MATESELSKSGKARQINYAWGNAKCQDFKTAGDILNYPDILSIHVDDLLEAFKSGLIDYFQEIDKDAARQEIVLKNAGAWITDLPLAVVTDILKNHIKEET